MKPIQKPTKMNKTESAWADQLQILKLAGEIIDWVYEPFGLRLADKTFYHPDFLVVKKTHFEIHEVKGFWRDDAKVKIKVAARQFPWFQFVVVMRGSKKAGWSVTRL